MTTTAGDTRIALVRARFADLPNLGLGTAGHLLTGLDDLFALEWMLEHPASRSDLTEAPSPVIRTLGVNSPMEVMLWITATGGAIGVAHQAVSLFERIHFARGTKVRADLVVATGRALIERLPDDLAIEPDVVASVKRAAEAVAMLDSLRIVDEDGNESG